MGLILLIIGEILKLLHLPGANLILLIGAFVKLVALLLGIWKTLTDKRFKDIINS